MQFDQDLVPGVPYVVERLRAHFEVGDERQVLLADDPQVRACLSVLLGQLTQVIVLGVRVQREKRCRHEDTDPGSDGTGAEHDGNTAARRHGRKKDLPEFDRSEPRQEDIGALLMGLVRVHDASIALAQLIFQNGL